MKIYEGEHHRRGFLEPGVDNSGVRALRLRKALPRLEMPCVRAATSSIGVRLDRLRVPRPLRRKIFALAFDLPDEDERLAEKRRDEKFLECLERWVKAGDVPPRRLVETPPADSDPPMVAGALDAAVAAALGGAPGLTGVAKEMSSLAEAPEPYVFSVFDQDFGFFDMSFHTLLNFELAFPALVLPAGCRELTIKSTCRRQAKICVGGDVRYEGCQSNEDYLAYHTGELSLPPVERTFTAPRTSPSGISYFSVADLARAVTELPEVYRQVGRLTGLCAFDADNDGALSYGKFEESGDSGYVRWGACALWLETWERKAKFSVVDGRSVLDVQWSVVCDGWGGNVDWTEPESCPCLEGATLDVTHHDEPKRILEYWCADAHEREDRRQHAWPRPTDDFSPPLHDLRRSVVDAKQWAPGWKLQRWQEYYHTGPGFPGTEGPAQDPRLINEHSRPMSPMGDFSSDSDDEDIDEAVLADSDDEDDVSAELICRPRTIGGVAQTRE